jgi:hypothetical protein
MKNVILLVSVMAMAGCAVGTDDPNGDDNLGTEPGGPTAGATKSNASSGSDSAAQGSEVFGHTNVFDPTPQVIPNRPGHGPAAPDPGPVHVGPGVPR